MDKVKWTKIAISCLSALAIVLGFVAMEYGIWLWAFTLDAPWSWCAAGLLAMIHGGMVYAWVDPL